MNSTTLSVSKIALALVIAFLIGGLSAWLWAARPSAPPQDAHAEREKLEARGSDEHGEHAEQGEHEEGKLTLSPEAQREAGITITEAVGGALEQTLDLPGEITLNADRVVHIVPRVGGIVQRVNKTPGDEVKAGEIMAVIESRELAETKAAYLAATQRLALAKATLASAEELRAKRILPGLEYLGTKRDFDNAGIELRTVTQKLHALGLTSTEITAITQDQDTGVAFAVYELRAPAAGTVTEKHITLGEVVENNSDVFVLADLSALWANVTVYAQDTPRLRVGQAAHITAEGFPIEATGTISYISPVVAEATRTATARVLVSNPDERWKPGTFVTAHIVLATEPVRTLVPNDAIQTVNNTPIVFVPEDNGFTPRPVTVGRANKTHSQILVGLEPGDRYVSAGALILSFTAIPALCVLGLGGKISEKENFLLEYIKRGYEPLLHWALRRRTPIALGVGGLVIATVLVAFRLGSEFIPKLSEGALALQPSRIPSISLTSSVEMQARVEKVLLERFPDEVALVFARTGTAEVATDPMGPNISDTYLMLRPQERWKKAASQEELAEEIEKVIANLPGQNFEFSQPIELRFNELIAGVRAELAVKVFGDDLQQLAAAGNKVAAGLNAVPGAADVKVEQVSGLPVLTVDIDRAAIARFGQNVSDVQGVIEIAMGGKSAGEVFQGDRRFDLVVRMPEDLRLDLEQLARLPIPLPAQEPDKSIKQANLLENAEPRPAYIPLSRLATIELKEGPNQISRENGRRRIVVSANVRGRDLGSFVAEAQQKIDAAVKLPEGYWITWGGQFENLMAARERLTVVVPPALFLIFLLLFASFHSVRLAALVFTGVPLALTGGVFALWLRDMPFTISAGVGFIALSGVAVLNGLMLVSFIRQLRTEGLSVEEAVVQGCLRRLRPVLMTALVASLGFVPMALATSMGAEVQRPLATVVIGGILSSTFLTLVVLPAIYGWFDHEHTQNAEEKYS